MVEQSKDERDAKAAKVYLGNVKVVWTNGSNVPAAPRQDGGGQSTNNSGARLAAVVEDDLPF